jgi:hypothetical protein
MSGIGILKFELLGIDLAERGELSPTPLVLSSSKHASQRGASIPFGRLLAAAAQDKLRQAQHERVGICHSGFPASI